MYYGVDYVNKESKNIDYITYNIGATIDWFKAGAAFKDVDGKIEPMLNLGMYTKADIKDLDNNVSNVPDIDIVYNEFSSQPQLRFSIALD